MVATPIRNIILTFKAYQEGPQWVSECIELGVASCDDTVDEALTALDDATQVYLESLNDEGERERVLRMRGVQILSSAALTKHEERAVHVRPNEVVTLHVTALA
ncbi:MAG: type II toxin-antitoxin system HicB family antitoxin [Dehalococcoidia bacterium]